MAIIQSEVKSNRGNDIQAGGYAENGLIYQSCMKKYSQAKDKLLDLGEEMIKAIEKKIWLGFLHPQSGQFCSFISHDEDGKINDEISFKLWLASDPKAGGLGITDLSIFSGMLKQNKRAMNLILPMIADGQSIREANRILESQGQAPILQFGRQKEYQLKKISQAPDSLRSFIILHDLPQYFASKAVNKFNEAFPEHPGLGDDLEAIIAKYPKPARNKKGRKEIIMALEECLGMDQNIQLRLSINNPEQMAQKIAGAIEKEKIKALIQNLEEILQQA